MQSESGARRQGHGVQTEEMRDLDKALADIIAIRSQLAAGTAFRGYGPAAIAATARRRADHRDPAILLASTIPPHHPLTFLVRLGGGRAAVGGDDLDRDAWRARAGIIRALRTP